MYDLYIFEPAFDCYKPKIVKKNLCMDELSYYLDFYNVDYKLTMKSIAYNFMNIDLTTKNNVIVFEAVKRSEDK